MVKIYSNIFFYKKIGILIKDASINPILVFKFDDNSKKMATPIKIQSNLELEGAPKLNIQVQTLDITNTTTH